MDIIYCYVTNLPQLHSHGSLGYDSNKGPQRQFVTLCGFPEYLGLECAGLRHLELGHGHVSSLSLHQHSSFEVVDFLVLKMMMCEQEGASLT